MKAKFVNETISFGGPVKLDSYEKKTIDEADQIIVYVGPKGGLKGMSIDSKNTHMYISGVEGGFFSQSLKLAYDYAKNSGKNIIYKPYNK